MRANKTVAIWAGAGVSITVLIALLLVSDRPGAVRGAEMIDSPDPMKQLPITGVEITVTGASGTPEVRSDASGFFSILLSWRMRVGERVSLHFYHDGYQPLDLRYLGANKLYLARLIPLPAAQGPEVTIANVVAKYSINTTTTVNIGSAVKTFEVVNQGNGQCKRQEPCSPDGKWKAALGSAMIDAGPGNEFHNARASCIAGPCPFTRIEGKLNRSPASRTLRVSALDWSDTATS